MKILGISCYYHDSAAALIDNGKIIAAAEEERFSRIKHDSDFPKLAISFCLEQAGINSKDLNYVVFYEKPYIKFERILLQTLFTFPSSRKLFVEAMREWLPKKLWIKSSIVNHLEINADKIYFCDHHVSHAASAFYPSPFKKAAILTLDGVGEWTVAGWGLGTGNIINIYKELRFPHSLGLLYSVFTAFLGFEVNEGEYKVMGMAPYGNPRFTDKIKKTLELNKDGSIKLDMSYFTFHSSPEKSFSEKFVSLFGKPRDKNDLFFTKKTGYPRFWGKRPKNYEIKCKENQKYADLAASIQQVTEQVILTMCKHVYKETGVSNLCMAGGVALNSVANGKIVRLTPFKNLWVQPAAGDSGGALGAALYLYHNILNNKKRYQMTHAYFGKGYQPNEIKRFLNSNSIPYTQYNPEKLTKFIAKALNQEKVVGWFEGRFEWGPRALGHRSILADPRHLSMKDIVNSKIKFREPYRPFAPAVLEEEAKKYFDIANPNSGPARFMIIVIPAKKPKTIPAVSHLGTSRIQSVNKKLSPEYYALIKEFGKLTGVPVIMNTSFNLKGEPIVTSPSDAFKTFMKSGIDFLVLENFVVEKKLVMDFNLNNLK